MKKKLLILILIAVISISCAKKTVLRDTTINEADLFEKAMGFYNNKKWDKAIDEFQKYIFSFPASRRSEQVQYYLADVFFMKKDYSQAIVEFEYFLRTSKNYELNKNAYNKLCMSYYNLSPSYKFDQQLTKKAISVMEDFMIDYPDFEGILLVDSLYRNLLSRIEEKKMHTANHYYKRGNFKAAEIYYESVVIENLIERHYNFYLFGYGTTLYRLKKYEEASYILKMIDKSSNYGKKSQKYIKSIEKNI